MDTKNSLVLGVHAIIGAGFMGLAALGLANGVEPAAAGLRFMIGVLVVALGYTVARIL
jgi:hypothetical protein